MPLQLWSPSFSALLAKSTFRSGFLVLIPFLGLSLLAHTALPAEAQTDNSTGPATDSSLVIPAGTRLPLVLTQQISSKSTRVGDELHLQVTSPLAIEGQVLVPAGTYIQGKIEKIDQHHNQLTMVLHSASLIFSNNYVVEIPGSMPLRSSEEWLQPASGPGAAVLAAFVAPMAGGSIGAAAGQGKGAAVGLGVGAGVGLVAALALAARHHGPNFVLYAGSPIEAVVSSPVSLNRQRIADALAHPGHDPIQPTIPPLNTPANSQTSPLTCPAGQEWCGGSCVDTSSFINDSNNCGRCGNHCSFSESCTGGSCSCAPGYASCMGTCMNSASFMGDNNNCGRCGNSCSIGQSCMGGTCMRTSPCVPGDITCQ